MNNIVLGAIIIVLVIGGYFVYLNNYKDLDQELADLKNEVAESETGTVEKDVVLDLEDGPSVIPLSHASFIMVWDETVIYVDPVGEVGNFENQLVPDIVLVTDVHGDHLSTSTLEGIVNGDTRLVVPEAVYDRLTSSLQEQAQILSNDENINLDNLFVTATPMYNLPESDDAYHPRGRGNGYLLELDETRVYIAGDTSNTPEMRSLQNIDMAFVPMNLPYTMDVTEASEAVLAFAPKTVIPYHYRGSDGLSDVAHFRELVRLVNPDLKVLLLDWYPETETE